MTLFSKKVYDLCNQFMDCIKAKSSEDIIYLLLPTWKYHVRIAEAKVLDVFAEYILKLLATGLTDTRRIADTLGLNVELVKHIRERTLLPYFYHNELTQEGKYYLQNNFSLSNNSVIYDYLVFTDVRNGNVLAIQEETDYLVQQPINSFSQKIRIGQRRNSFDITPIAIEWQKKTKCNKESISDYLLHHSLTCSTENDRELVNPHVVSCSDFSEPVYLLTSLTRPVVVTDQYTWIAHNVETGIPDTPTTLLVRDLEMHDANLAERIQRVFFSNVSKGSISEEKRQAVSFINKKLPILDLLPAEMQELLWEYQDAINNAEMAQKEHFSYRLKLQAANTNMRKFIEATMYSLNRKYEYVIKHTVFEDLRYWDRQRRLPEKIDDLFVNQLQQDLSKIPKLSINLKYDFSDGLPVKHKIQTNILCAAIVSVYRQTHPFKTAALKSELFLNNLLNLVYKLNKSAHADYNDISFNEIKDMENLIFSDCSEIIKHTYDIK